MLEQPEKMIGPLLKVLVNDLGDLLVVGNLRVEGFAGDCVDVCDELVLDGRAHHLGADYACATCDDDLHIYCLVVCTNLIDCRMSRWWKRPGDASSPLRGLERRLGGSCDSLPSMPTLILLTTTIRTSSTPSQLLFSHQLSDQSADFISNRRIKLGKLTFTWSSISSIEKRAIYTSTVSQAPASSSSLGTCQLWRSPACTSRCSLARFSVTLMRLETYLRYRRDGSSPHPSFDYGTLSASFVCALRHWKFQNVFFFEPAGRNSQLHIQPSHSRHQ